MGDRSLFGGAAPPERHICSLDRGVVIDILKRVRHETRRFHRRQAPRIGVEKLILLFRSVPSDDIKLRELLEKFRLIERFTPYVSGGRGPSEARKQGSGWRADETRPLLKSR